MKMNIYHEILEAKLAEAEYKACLAEAEFKDLEDEIKFRLEQRDTTRKELARQVNDEQESRRPSRRLFPEIFMDGREFVCKYSEIEARGTSPEIACDNFDHLWLYGCNE